MQRRTSQCLSAMPGRQLLSTWPILSSTAPCVLVYLPLLEFSSAVLRRSWITWLFRTAAAAVGLFFWSKLPFNQDNTFYKIILLCLGLLETRTLYKVITLYDNLFVYYSFDSTSHEFTPYFACLTENYLFMLPYGLFTVWVLLGIQ